MLGTIVIQSECGDAPDFAELPDCHAVQSRACSDGLHHVLTIAQSRHRLWQSSSKSTIGSTYLVHDDRFALWRAEALFRFLSARNGRKTLSASPSFTPSTYQRRRLAWMLAMLDARNDECTARELAFGLVYRNTKPLKGAQWKASGEKRHTLRLLRTALNLRDGGYRAFPGFDRSIHSGVTA